MAGTFNQKGIVPLDCGWGINRWKEIKIFGRNCLVNNEFVSK
jgi:hypothetical protein